MSVRAVEEFDVQGAANISSPFAGVMWVESFKQPAVRQTEHGCAGTVLRQSKVVVSM